MNLIVYVSLHEWLLYLFELLFSFPGLSLGSLAGVCAFSLLKLVGVTMSDVRDASYNFALAQHRFVS